ncbi:sodium-dependent proline transporter-like [Liolophura sinensis]|uniref:sodium-dependent proline transporter-like n=1 Tax=Liolophura sinensis TaxID=3198878 RepID=UPI0031586723
MSTENPPGDTGIIIEKLSRIEASVEDLQNKVEQVTGDVRALRGNKVSKSLPDLAYQYVTHLSDHMTRSNGAEIILLLTSTQDDEVDSDTSPNRGNWGSKLEFLLSCLGYAVGLGNVWRFPYLCYKNGGGAFFIPYCIMLFFVGIPIFLLELALGQFSSQGPLTCWKFAPAFKGVGVAMMVVSCLVAIYYNMILAWSIYYLFASCTTELPWTSCGDWSSPYCSDKLTDVTFDNCTQLFYNASDNGVCYQNGTVYGIWNQTVAKSYGISKSTPAGDYLNAVVLGITDSSGIGDVGMLRWELVLCYLAAWVVVYLALINGVKSSGKVVYFTATFPYIVLVILLVRGVTLPGYMDGINFYITPNLERLRDARVWKDAAVQIFFSLSASWGGLIALSSYNKFRNDIVRDTFIVTIGNCATSVFAGFVVFSFLGYMSNELGIPVSEVAKSGVTLAFEVYPTAVASMPASWVWAILFFLMLITLGLDSQFVLVETVTTAISDQFPCVRPYRSLTNLMYCVTLFVLGLTLCTNAGAYWLQIMDHYAGGWNVLIIAVCECWGVSLVYGIWRFLGDIEVMLGNRVCCCCTWTVCRLWWGFTWLILTPVGVLFILGFSLYDYEDATYGDEQFPTWANALGWLMTLAVVAAIIITPIIMFVTGSGTASERFRSLFKPTVDWGPALVKHRKLIIHAEIVEDPWSRPKDVRTPNGVVLVSKSMPYSQRDGITNPIYDNGPAFYQSAEDPSVFIVPELDRKSKYVPEADQAPNETSTPRF